MHLKYLLGKNIGKKVREYFRQHSSYINFEGGLFIKSLGVTGVRFELN